MPSAGCQTREANDAATQTEIPWATLPDPAAASALASAVRAALPAVLGALRLSAPLPDTDEPPPAPPRTARRRRPPPSAVLTSRRVLPGAPDRRVTCLAVGECDEREAGGGNAAEDAGGPADAPAHPSRPLPAPSCAIAFAVGWARTGPGVEPEGAATGSSAGPGSGQGSDKAGAAAAGAGPNGSGHPDAARAGPDEAGDAEAGPRRPALHEPRHRRERVPVSMGPKQAREMQARARQAALEDARERGREGEASGAGGRRGEGGQAGGGGPAAGGEIAGAAGRADASTPSGPSVDADAGASREREDAPDAARRGAAARGRASSAQAGPADRPRVALPPTAGGIIAAYLTARGDAAGREDLWAPSPPLALAFARERDSGGWLLAAGLACGHVLVFREGGEGGLLAIHGGGVGDGLEGMAPGGGCGGAAPGAGFGGTKTAPVRTSNGVAGATGALPSVTPPGPASHLSVTPSASPTPPPGSPLADQGVVPPPAFPPPRLPFLLGAPAAPKPEPCVALEWSLDGHVLASCNRSGVVRLWRVDGLNQGTGADRTPSDRGRQRPAGVQEARGGGESAPGGRGDASMGLQSPFYRPLAAAQPLAPSPQPSPGIAPTPSPLPSATPPPVPPPLATHPALPPARLAVSPLPRAWRPFRIVSPPGGWVDRLLRAQPGAGPAGQLGPGAGSRASGPPRLSGGGVDAKRGAALALSKPRGDLAAAQPSSSGVPLSSLALLDLLSPMHSAPLPTWTRRRGRKALAFLGGDAPKVLAFDVPEGRGHAWGSSAEWEGRDWEGGFGAGATAGAAPGAPTVAPLGLAPMPGGAVEPASTPPASLLRLEPRAPGRLAAVATLPPPLDRIVISVGPLGGAVWDAGRRAYKRSSGGDGVGNDDDDDDGDDDEDDEDGGDEDEGDDEDKDAWAWPTGPGGAAGVPNGRASDVFALSTPQTSTALGGAREPGAAAAFPWRFRLVTAPPSTSAAAEAAAASGYLNTRHRYTLDEWRERVGAAAGRVRPGLSGYAPASASTAPRGASVYLSALGAHVPRAVAPPAASASAPTTARLIARFAAGKSRDAGRGGGLGVARGGVELGVGGSGARHGAGAPGGAQAGGVPASAGGPISHGTVPAAAHGSASATASAPSPFATYSPLSLPHSILFPPVVASRACPGVVYVALSGGGVEVWDLAASLAAPRRRWRPCRADVVAGVSLPPSRRRRREEGAEADETPEDRLLLADANGAVHLCIAGKRERGKGRRDAEEDGEARAGVGSEAPSNGASDEDGEYLSRLALLDGVLVAERSRLVDEAVGEMLADGDDDEGDEDGDEEARVVG